MIVLDLEMPVMDGVTALPELLAACPGAAVMIASTLTRNNARLSMRCLALGAVEILPKPDTNRDLTLSQSFREEFITKIAALSRVKAKAVRKSGLSAGIWPGQASGKIPGNAARALVAQPGTRISASLSSHVSQAPRYLVIGASTGGPRAIAQVLGDIKSVLPHLTTLIVQHMPPMFTASFAEQVSSQLGMPVREPANGERAVKGGIYIAPGGRHMGVSRANGQAVLRVTDGPPVKFCRPSVDVLFHDVAAQLGPSALAVILTGMGRDGAQGLLEMRNAGAHTLGQDEASCVVYGMPRVAHEIGAVERQLPLNRLSSAILDLCASSRAQTVV